MLARVKKYKKINTAELGYKGMKGAENIMVLQTNVIINEQYG